MNKLLQFVAVSRIKALLMGRRISDKTPANRKDFQN